ncbi:MAG TPA: signal peptidase II [Candidatus Sumerlaeota bacterium]|nr:signal peptidase II [Candidatus Sumerlaeota bacterium]
MTPPRETAVPQPLERPRGPLAAPFDPAWPVGRVAFTALAAVVILLDQLTKWLAVAFLRGRPPLELIPGYLRLWYAENTGAAFSVLEGHTEILAGFSLIVSVVIFVWGWRLSPREQGLRVALGLILGGALGNLIDRVYLRYVIDFISAHWHYKYVWPTFNIADSAVCVGMFLLIVASFRIPSAPAKSADSPGST